MTSEELKTHLNIVYPKTYIQKSLGLAKNIYLVTFDSRYPEKSIPLRLFKNSLSSQVYKSTTNLLEPISNLKFTYPVLIENYINDIIENSYIVVRDLGGEMFLKNRNLIPLSFIKKGELI